MRRYSAHKGAFIINDFFYEIPTLGSKGAAAVAGLAEPIGMAGNSFQPKFSHNCSFYC